MKKLFTTFLAVGILAGSVFAQGHLTRKQILDKNPNAKAVATAKARVGATGFEPSQAVALPTGVESRADDCIIGETWYDLQTNNSIPRRIQKRADGTHSAIWTFASDAGAADRGMGYNQQTSATGCAWGPAPTARLEAARTGFGALCMTSDGAEHVFSHLGAGIIAHNKKEVGSSTWVQKNVPHQTVPGGLWPRATASGNTLHMIYLTLPTGNGGAIVDGLDGQVLYNRSTDGGATWDKVDIRLPGLDSTKFNRVSAEDYSIDANGNTVAIGIYAFNGDKLAIISRDNGTTWETERVVQDFPHDDWWIDLPYDTVATNAAYDTTFHPAQGTWLTGDGSGDILVDDNGLVHFWYSSLFILDNDWATAGYNYYPRYDLLGIVYWNELMADDNSKGNSFVGFTSGYAPDLDGDNAHGANLEHYAEYGWAMPTAPQAGLGDNGEIYLVFNAPNELDINADGNTMFRKTFITASTGTDNAWFDPVPVATSANADGFLLEFQEHLYGAIARDVDGGNCHIIAQVDYIQGQLQQAAPTEASTINYFPITITGAAPDASWISGTTQTVRNDLGATLMPNPTSANTMLSFKLDQGVQGNVVIYDMAGRQVYRSTTRNFNAGFNQQIINTSELNAGIYTVQLNTESFISTVKMVVTK